VLELLSVCSAPVLRALLLWIIVFVGAVMLLGLGLFLLAQRRIRRLAADPARPLRESGVWSVRLLLIIVQANLLPAFALVIAVPFALERGVATAIESASPRVVDWGARMGTDALKRKFAIADGSAIVDLGELAPFLRSVPPAASKARGIFGALRHVPALTTNTYYRAVDSVVGRAAGADLRLTWDDLFRSVHEQFRALWNGQAKIVAGFLRASSLHFLVILAATTAVVDVLCLLAILLLTRRPSAPVTP
jgi:hypothetical protein